jgi:transposase
LRKDEIIYWMEKAEKWKMIALTNSAGAHLKVEEESLQHLTENPAGVSAQMEVENKDEEGDDEDDKELKADGVQIVFHPKEFDADAHQRIALTLFDHFSNQMTRTDAYIKTSEMCGISVRTIQRWKTKYTKTGVLTGKVHAGGPKWVFDDEELARQAREWCRSQLKGFTTQNFIDDFLQKNESTKHIHKLSTAQKYLRRLGWKYGRGKAGIYLDGHERPDVVESRKIFCSKIMELASNENVVFIAQDESIYHAKEDIEVTWNEGGVRTKKKGKGKEIMISAWMDRNGILKLSNDEWNVAKEVNNPQIPQEALFTLKFGREWGYYDYSKFDNDVTFAIKIAKNRYPNKQIAITSNLHWTGESQCLGSSFFCVSVLNLQMNR